MYFKTPDFCMIIFKTHSFVILNPLFTDLFINLFLFKILIFSNQVLDQLFKYFKRHHLHKINYLQFNFL